MYLGIDLTFLMFCGYLSTGYPQVYPHPSLSDCKMVLQKRKNYLYYCYADFLDDILRYFDRCFWLYLYFHLFG